MPQTPPQTDTYNTALDIFDRTHPLRVDAEENLKVVLASGSIDIGKVDQGLPGSLPWLVTVVPSTSGVNIFATNNTVTNGLETTVLSYTTTFPFHISQMIGWGTFDAEFLIRLNGTIVGGGRSSPAQRMINVLYDVAPIATNTGDVVTVTVLEYGSGLQKFRVNLLGE